MWFRATLSEVCGSWYRDPDILFIYKICDKYLPEPQRPPFPIYLWWHLFILLTSATANLQFFACIDTAAKEISLGNLKGQNLRKELDFFGVGWMINEKKITFKKNSLSGTLQFANRTATEYGENKPQNNIIFLSKSKGYHPKII